jgi:MFS family permease
MRGDATASMRALVGFAALGVYWGAWGAALPAVQRQARADDGQLGVALVLVGLGALISMRATGVLIDRLGPRLTSWTVGAFGVAAILPALAGSPGELYVLLFVVGAASGAMDVAINTDAVREEARTDRSVLNLAHAVFSASVVVASLGTGAVRWAGGGPGPVFAFAAALVLLGALAMRAGAPQSWEPPTAGGRPTLFQRVPGWVLVIGLLGATAFWIENAWQSWGAVHLERTLDASPAASSLGPALFASAMAAGRVAVHRFARRGAERTVLVAGAAVAGAGSAVAALAGSVPVALTGIVLAGAGCAMWAPTLLSLVGRAAGSQDRATTVGSVTSLMYLGFLVGPAAVGGVAELATLRASLGAVAGLAFLLSLAFAVVRFPADEARQSDRPRRRRS